MILDERLLSGLMLKYEVDISNFCSTVYDYKFTRLQFNLYVIASVICSTLFILKEMKHLKAPLKFTNLIYLISTNFVM